MQASYSEIQHAFENINYPITKKQLLEEARNRNFSEGGMQILENTPDRQYTSFADVYQEFEGFQKAMQFFHNRKYPAKKQELVAEAKSFNVRDVIVRALEACPDKEYTSPTDVIQECRARYQER